MFNSFDLQALSVVGVGFYALPMGRIGPMLDMQDRAAITAE